VHLFITKTQEAMKLERRPKKFVQFEMDFQSLEQAQDFCLLLSKVPLSFDFNLKLPFGVKFSELKVFWKKKMTSIREMPPQFLCISSDWWVRSYINQKMMILFDKGFHIPGVKDDCGLDLQISGSQTCCSSATNENIIFKRYWLQAKFKIVMISKVDFGMVNTFSANYD
jgi:hypothetical protein